MSQCMFYNFFKYQNISFYGSEWMIQKIIVFGTIKRGALIKEQQSCEIYTQLQIKYIMPRLSKNKMKWMLIILAYIAAKAQGQAISIEDVQTGHVHQMEVQDPIPVTTDFVPKILIVGGPEVLNKEQYEADPEFVKIDQLLRKEKNLEGSEVVQVKRQLVNGNNYWVTYKDRQGKRSTYKVYASFKGDLQLKSDEQHSPVIILTKTKDLPQQKNIVRNQILEGAPGTLTKEEYLADENFLNIDAKLRKENDLVGFDVTEVRRQLVNGNNYWVTYKNFKGDTFVFEVYASFKGELEVKNKAKAIPVPSTEPVGLTIVPPPPKPTAEILIAHTPIVGAPGTLTKEEYLADENFLNIDAKLRKENDLVGFDVTEVRRQLVNGNNYWVTYKNFKGDTFVFEVYASFKGELEVKNKAKAIPVPSTEPVGLTIVPPPPKPTAEILIAHTPIVGAPGTLTKEEYLADENFLNIDAKLRKENDLVGFDVTEVRRQLVNGNNYWVTYKNFKGDTFVFEVYASFKGELEVKNTLQTAPSLSFTHNLQSSSPFLPDDIEKSPGFSISYTALMKDYAYFLPNAKVRSIHASADPFNKQVTIYDVVLDTNNGVFQSFLAFNNVSLAPQIKSLVVYNPRHLRRM